jgi:hypothetical protein
LRKRQERQSGKRAGIKGPFLLTTFEIHDKVGVVELEITQRKVSKSNQPENASDLKHHQMMKKKRKRKVAVGRKQFGWLHCG